MFEITGGELQFILGTLENCQDELDSCQEDGWVTTTSDLTKDIEQCREILASLRKKELEEMLDECDSDK